MPRLKLPVLAVLLCCAAAAPVIGQETPGQSLPTDAVPDPATPTPPPAVAKPDEPMNISPSAPEPAQMWHVVSTTTINGLAPATATTEMCISDADLERPPAELGGLKCDARDFQITGNTLTWTGTCGSAEGSGKLVFASDRKAFTGDIVATQGPLKSTMKIDARSTGACVK